MSFIEKIRRRWKTNKTLLCVGLDSSIEKIPEHLRLASEPLFEFNKQIIDGTHDLVCAYKPQFAYYGAQSAEDQLLKTMDYIKEKYRDIPIILDSKRGDIGATSEMYARESFDRYGADAVTVNPYMGGETLLPFFERKDRGVVVLCKTSNPGSGEFQDIDCGGKPLYEIVAGKASKCWNKNENVMLVVGATHPEQLSRIRSIVGDMPLLIPGIGAQGGDIEAVLSQGADSEGLGLVISSSRAVIYADSSRNFVAGARKVAQSICDQVGLK